MFAYLSGNPGSALIAEGEPFVGFTTIALKSSVDPVHGHPIGSGIIPDIWDVSPTTASIVSSDAADSIAGTGARTVDIIGLDENFRFIGESIELNGLTPVVSSLTYLRINRLIARGGGSTQHNQGDITATIDGQVVATAAMGKGINQDARFTVPSDWKSGALITRVWANISCSVVPVSAHVGFRVRRAPGEVWIEPGPIVVGSSGGVVTAKLEAPVTVSPGADIQMVCSSVDQNMTCLNAGFDTLRAVDRHGP